MSASLFAPVASRAPSPTPRRPSSRGPGPAHDLVRVFEHEPDLLGGLDPGVADHLRHQALARKEWIEPGPWGALIASGQDRRQGVLGLLVLDGLLQRRVTLDGRACPELLGAGDLIRPWDQDDDLSTVPHVTSWTALTRTTVAVLDERFTRFACQWPSVTNALMARSVQRSSSLAFHLAIAHVRHAETRLRMLLWHLADRWGKVTGAGVVLALPLTVELLAQLACMRRPTASTALGVLMRGGELARQRDGSWLLGGSSPVAPSHRPAAPSEAIAA